MQQTRNVIISLRAEIPAGSTEVNLLEEDLNTSVASVTGLQESDIIQFIRNRKDILNLLQEELGMEDVKFFFNVEEPMVKKGSKPGDIDIIAIDTNEVQRSIGIEVKTITSRFLRESSYVKINRGGHLKKAPSQINGYLKLGFAQVFLLIIILDDARESEEMNQLLKSSGGSIGAKEIKDMLNSRFSEEAGIIYLQLAQIQNKSINERVKASIEVLSPASLRVQSQECTGKLLELMSNESKRLPNH